MRRLLIAFMAMALVASACSPGGSSESSVSSQGSTNTSSPDGSVSSPDGTLEDVPPVPILTPSDPIVEPGDDVVVATDPRVTGTVVMVGPSGDITSAPLANGSATLSVPGGTANGTYRMKVDGSSSAIGFISVSNGPGLWVNVPEFALPGEEIEVVATTYGIPSDMLVALEVTNGGGSVDRLVPHPFVDLAPVISSSTEGLPAGVSLWTLPADFDGTVRLVADDPERLDQRSTYEGDPAYVSTTQDVQRCDAAGVITGDLGTSGFVRASWIDTSVAAASAETEDGTFSLEVRPGTVVVSVYRGSDMTEASPMVLRVKCGESIDIGTGEVPVDTGPAPGTFLGGLALDDLFSFEAESTGDITLGPTGFADCSMSNGVLSVSLDSAGVDELILFDLDVADFDGTGRYEGTFTATDLFSDDASSGTFAVDVEYAVVEGMDAVGGAFRGDIAGAIGEATIEGTFRCVLFGGLETAARSLPEPPSAAEVRLFAGSSSDEPCRRGYALTVETDDPLTASGVDRVASILTARLTDSVKRVQWVSSGDVRVTLTAEASRQLMDPETAAQVNTRLGEALQSDFILTVEITPLEGKFIGTVRLLKTDPMRLVVGIDALGDGRLDVAEELVDQWRKLKRGLKKASICGKVTPESLPTKPGEQQKVSYQTTDLEGVPVDATVDRVASSCGTFSPDSGQTVGNANPPQGTASEVAYTVDPVPIGIEVASAGTFETTFTAEAAGCTDEVTFVARTDTPSGEVTTADDAQESTVQIVTPMYGFKVSISLLAGTQYLTSESTGEFFVESEYGGIIGFGTGTTHWQIDEFPCLVMSEEGFEDRTQVFIGDGTYSVMPVGELVSGDAASGGTLRFSPRGYQSSLAVSYSDPDCFPEGTSTNDIFGGVFFALTTFYPDIYAGAPQGFEVPFKADGSRTSKTWQFVGYDGTVTLEVWSEEPPGGDA